MLRSRHALARAAAHLTHVGQGNDGKADGDGSPRFFAGLEFGNERGDACDHFFFVPFLAVALALVAALLGASARRISGRVKRCGWWT